AFTLTLVPPGFALALTGLAFWAEQGPAEEPFLASEEKDDDDQSDCSRSDAASSPGTCRQVLGRRAQCLLWALGQPGVTSAVLLRMGLGPGSAAVAALGGDQQQQQKQQQQQQ
ncbi:unnamed protein product, partial [Polarella glacialis]